LTGYSARDDDDADRRGILQTDQTMSDIIEQVDL